jgi:hypothetical protein
LDVDFDGPILMFLSSPVPVEALKSLVMVGTSLPPHAEATKYQGYLKKVPGEFRDIEKQLLKG